MILEPDKSRTFSTPMYQNLVRTGVIGDGSCFFHALLYALSSSYRKMNHAERVMHVIDLRNKIVNSMSYTKWKNLGDGETFRMLIVGELRVKFDKIEKWDKEILPDLANNWKDKSMVTCAEIIDKYQIIEDVQGLIDEVTKKAFQGFINHLRSEWVDEFMLEYLSITFECNFLFIDANTRKPYNIISRNQYDKYVVFCWIGESHYEIVGEIGSNNIAKRIFDKSHPLIQSISG